MQLTTTNIRDLEEMNALNNSQNGYTHKEVLFAAAAVAYQRKPDITPLGLYSLLYDESDTAMAVELNAINSDESDWAEFCSDAENFADCINATDPTYRVDDGCGTELIQTGNLDAALEVYKANETNPLNPPRLTRTDWDGAIGTARFNDAGELRWEY